MVLAMGYNDTRLAKQAVSNRTSHLFTVITIDVRPLLCTLQNMAAASSSHCACCAKQGVSNDDKVCFGIDDIRFVSQSACKSVSGIPSSASDEGVALTADVVILVMLCKQTLSAEHPRVLIPELCRLFYTLGWVTGTGGGISIRAGYSVPSQHSSA